MKNSKKMVNKEITIQDTSKKFIFTIKYELNPTYLTTLLLIHSNNSAIEFKQRSKSNPYDVHGFEVSWQICDEMIDIGLLSEDIESFDVRYVITPLGAEIINKIKRK